MFDRYSWTYEALIGCFQDPEFFLFLRQCLIRQGNRLSRHGITWNAPGKGVITSKFIPTVCTVDAKARCIIMNMMGPTGFFGCTFCPIEGVQANGVHFPFEGEMTEPKIDAQLRALMETAHNNPAENDNPYYIGAPADIALINARLVSITIPPKLLARTLRGIDTRAKWRGHEWRNWILYYAYPYPCLTGLLPLRYLRHLLKLFRATFLVSRDSATEADLEEAEVLFTEYVRNFQEFFGVQ
ncbi:hypothetical protein FOCC_FOCC012274 [Frankliniella occidentalis]|nr:hypothetical protein FOCC_FOCC012274 [Frankliniella occidentalis]